MRWIRYILVFALMSTSLAGCGSTREEVAVEPRPPSRTDIAIKVVDVSNDTRELFDVDAIGLLWNALDESLKNRGLLARADSPNPPLRLEAHITEYQKGNVVMRNILPPWGKTLLAVKCNLKDGDRLIASVESKSTVSIGSEGFTIGAWRKIFSSVSEDLVSELLRKI